MTRLSGLTLAAGLLAVALAGTEGFAADDKRLELTAGKQMSDMDAWIEKTKHPTEWWSWGADLRLRTIYAKNFLFFNSGNPSDVDERHFQRYRARWWSKFDLDGVGLANVDLNVRLTWEARTYPEPDPFDSWYGGTIMFDHLNVKAEKLFDLPVTLTVGRQDIILGNGWLVLDGTPLDGSRTIFFDAVRFDWKATDDHTLSLIYIDQSGTDDRLFHPINDLEEDNIEQEERGVIAWYSNKSLLEDGEFNAYFMYKQMEALTGRIRNNGGSNFGSWGQDGEIYCVGLRAVKKFDENWSARGEFAHQFGHKMTANPAPAPAGLGNTTSAFGLNTRLTYDFNDDSKTSVFAAYEWLSGDDPNTATNESFDIMWGRWPQFSELYIYSYATETRIADVTNIHRVGLGVVTHPHEKIELCGSWNIIFADENTYKGAVGFSGGELRGNQLAAVMRYKLNSHISGHLLGEVFFPGNYYGQPRNDPATFLRGELTFTW